MERTNRGRKKQPPRKPWCEIGKHTSYQLYAKWQGKVACGSCYQKERIKEPEVKRRRKILQRRYLKKLRMSHGYRYRHDKEYREEYLKKHRLKKLAQIRLAKGKVGKN